MLHLCMKILKIKIIVSYVIISKKKIKKNNYYTNS